MKLPTKSALEATAYHEAGHMVAACHLGLRIRSATIAPGDGYSGMVRHESPLRGIHLEFDDSDKARTKADRAALICLAGPAAQRRFRPRSWRSYHGHSDHALAVDLALQFNGGDEELAGAYLRWLELRADRLVADNWPLVSAFAGRLLESGTLNSREAKAIAENVEGRT